MWMIYIQTSKIENVLKCIIFSIINSLKLQWSANVNSRAGYSKLSFICTFKFAGLCTICKCAQQNQGIYKHIAHASIWWLWKSKIKDSLFLHSQLKSFQSTEESYPLSHKEGAQSLSDQSIPDCFSPLQWLSTGFHSFPFIFLIKIQLYPFRRQFSRHRRSSLLPVLLQLSLMQSLLKHSLDAGLVLQFTKRDSDPADLPWQVKKEMIITKYHKHTEKMDDFSALNSLVPPKCLR